MPLHSLSISYLNQKYDSLPTLISAGQTPEKPMLNKEFLNYLSDQITRLLPMAAEARDEVNKNVHKTLEGAFARLNLVTREEFEAQLKVLERAEQTIARLEEKIDALEKDKGTSD